MDYWMLLTTYIIATGITTTTFKCIAASSLREGTFNCTSSNCTCEFVSRHCRMGKCVKRELTKVFCQDHGLQTVPDGIPKNTLLLDLSSNNLTDFSSGEIPGLDLLSELHLKNNNLVNISVKHSNVEWVVLNNNAISDISNSFKNLTYLVRLGLHGNKIAKIPSDLLVGIPYLQVLILSSNRMKEIPQLHLLRLKYLTLANNSIASVTRNDFRLLEGLTQLYLGHNEIAKIEHFAFQYLQSLAVLDLSCNLLKHVPSLGISSVSNFESLNLSNNQIQFVDKDSFASLTALKFLSLANNDISHIHSMAFDSFQSLEHLNLRNNSFTCDCSLYYGFSKWLRFHYDISVTGAVCKSPVEWEETEIRSLNWVHLCPKECGQVVAIILFILAIIYLYRKSLQRSLARMLSFASVLFARLSGIFQRQEKSLGQMIIFPEVLGRGSNGTKVHKGRLKHDGRDVAVKKLVTGKISAHEVNMLLQLSKETYSQNVVRYFLCEKDSLFTFIALELCEGTLKDFLRGQVAHPDCVLPQKEILKGIANGIDFLHGHANKIIHRDIKPENVLISYPNANGTRRAMLADLGLARQLSRSESSFQTYHPYGTVGWIAPEMMTPSAKKTPKLDIFSAGCTFFFAITKGVHPFGDLADPENCQTKIVDESFSVSLDLLAAEGSMEPNEEILLKDLISSMIRRDWNARSNSSEVVNHPYFWNAKETLEFFHKVAKICKRDEEEFPAIGVFKERLENNAAIVIGGDEADWLLKFDKKLRSDVGWLKKHRKEVYGIVMTVRNKEEHYDEFSSERKRLYGEYPDGFLYYFTSRFPLLVLETYNAYNQCLKNVIS